MSEDNAELEDEDSGIFWTQDEGAPEDNPGEILSQDRKELILATQVELKENTACGWLTVASWRSSSDLFHFLIFLEQTIKKVMFPIKWISMCSIARSPTMLTGSPVLCRPLLTRMDTHQSLIIRQRWKSAEKTDEVTGYYFTLRNVIEEFRWIESDKLSNKFLFVHIFWLSQVIHKKTRMWCYCQLTILLWRSQQSMYHCGARCKDICLVSCRRRQKNWGI